MIPRSASHWSLRPLLLALLLPVAGCGGHHGPITVQVENRYPAPIEVYQTGLDPSGKRVTTLLGKAGAKGSATFPKALAPGEKVYHLQFKQDGKTVGDVIVPGQSMEKKLGSGETWSVTASP